MYMNKGKSIIVILCSLMLFISQQVSSNSSNFAEVGNLNIEKLQDPCPDDNELNRDIMESFLTSPDWSKERNETGIEGLSTSQIDVLVQSNYSDVCKNLNNLLQETISTTTSSGKPRYNLTYYKAGSHYFAVVTLRQPDDPDEVVFGLAALIIYDSNLNKIVGYSF